MSRQTLRGLALLAGLALAVTQFLLQPSSLAVFANPPLAAVILGAAATGLGFLVNLNCAPCIFAMAIVPRIRSCSLIFASFWGW